MTPISSSPNNTHLAPSEAQMETSHSTFQASSSVSDDDSDDSDFIPPTDMDISTGTAHEDSDSEEYNQHLQWLQKQWKGDISSWYKHDEAYWEKKASSTDEMTGGDEELHKFDIQESLQFIQNAKMNEPQLEKALDSGNARACDVGSGIGRITKTVLLPSKVHTVDLLERNQNFLNDAQKDLEKLNPQGFYFQCHLHDFPVERFVKEHPLIDGNPQKKQLYDIIWIQWLAMYLTDDDLVGLLDRLGQFLKPHGILVLKESISYRLEVDQADCSTTRTIELYDSILNRLKDLYVIHTCPQKVFPEEYFGVQFWALKRKD